MSTSDAGGAGTAAAAATAAGASSNSGGDGGSSSSPAATDAAAAALKTSWVNVGSPTPPSPALQATPAPSPTPSSPPLPPRPSVLCEALVREWREAPPSSLPSSPSSRQASSEGGQDGPREGLLRLARCGKAAARLYFCDGAASPAPSPPPAPWWQAHLPLCSCADIADLSVASSSGGGHVLWLSLEGSKKRTGFVFLERVGGAAFGTPLGGDEGLFAALACKTEVEKAIAEASPAAATVAAAAAADPEASPSPSSRAEEEEEEEWRSYLYTSDEASQGGGGAPRPAAAAAFLGGGVRYVTKTLAAAAASVTEEGGGGTGRGGASPPLLHSVQKLHENVSDVVGEGAKGLAQFFAKAAASSSPPPPPPQKPQPSSDTRGRRMHRAGSEGSAEDAAEAAAATYSLRSSIVSPVLPAPAPLLFGQRCSCPQHKRIEAAAAAAAATDAAGLATAADARRLAAAVADAAPCAERREQALEAARAELFCRGGCEGGAARRVLWELVLLGQTSSAAAATASAARYRGLLAAYGEGLREDLPEAPPRAAGLPAHAWFAEQEKAILKDASRTDRGEQACFGAVCEAGEGGALEHLKNLLRAYVASEQGLQIGYVQGMSDVASVALCVARESGACVAFACLEALMRSMGPAFRDHAEPCRQRLHQILFHINKPLHDHLAAHDPEAMYCFRWMFMRFKREFSYEDVLRLWDVLISSPARDYHVVVGTALLDQLSTQLMQLDQFSSIMRFCQSLGCQVRVGDVIQHAHALWERLARGMDPSSQEAYNLLLLDELSDDGCSHEGDGVQVEAAPAAPGATPEAAGEDAEDDLGDLEVVSAPPLHVVAASSGYDFNDDDDDDAFAVL